MAQSVLSKDLLCARVKEKQLPRQGNAKSAGDQRIHKYNTVEVQYIIFKWP